MPGEGCVGDKFSRGERRRDRRGGERLERWNGVWEESDGEGRVRKQTLDS